MCNISINNWSSSWTPHIDKVAGSYCKSNNHLHIRRRKLYIVINSNCRCLCTLRMGIECRLHFPNAYPVSTVQCRKCSWSDVCSAQELTPAAHYKLILNCQKFIQVSVTSKNCQLSCFSSELNTQSIWNHDIKWSFKFFGTSKSSNPLAYEN